MVKSNRTEALISDDAFAVGHPCLDSVSCRGEDITSAHRLDKYGLYFGDLGHIKAGERGLRKGSRIICGITAVIDIQFVIIQAGIDGQKTRNSIHVMVVTPHMNHVIAVPGIQDGVPGDGHDVDLIIPVCRIDHGQSVMGRFDVQGVVSEAELKVQFLQAMISDAAVYQPVADYRVRPHTESVKTILRERTAFICRTVAVINIQNVNLDVFVHFHIGVHRRIEIGIGVFHVSGIDSQGCRKRFIVYTCNYDIAVVLTGFGRISVGVIDCFCEIFGNYDKIVIRFDRVFAFHVFSGSRILQNHGPDFTGYNITAKRKRKRYGITVAVACGIHFGFAYGPECYSKIISGGASDDEGFTISPGGKPVNII